MNTKTINLGNILFLKINAPEYDLINLYKRFPNMIITNSDYDYEIFRMLQNRF